MIGYPPIARTAHGLPDLHGETWAVQVLSGGQRVAISDGRMWGAECGKTVTGFVTPPKPYDYQFEAELISAPRSPFHTAAILDIHVAGLEGMTFLERMEFLKLEFGLVVPFSRVRCVAGLKRHLDRASRDGKKALLLKRLGSLYIVADSPSQVDPNWVQVKCFPH